MSKDQKRKCESSSSSDSCSEVCHTVKCEPKCKQDCSMSSACPCIPTEKLVCQTRDAVVEIHSEFILLGASGPTGGITGGTPLAANSRADVVLEGNGFFIKGHYIVAPAHLVLLPPSLSSVARRYPFFDTQLLDGTFRNQLVPATRILVSVFNVNGKGKGYVYQANLVGVDGAGNLALLKINQRQQWNHCNPCIEKCHPYLRFGSSRSSRAGEKVFLIGDYVSNLLNAKAFNGSGMVAEGVLSDHRYVEYFGWGLHESVVVSAPAYSFSSGLPILNCQGRVIGMQTGDVTGTSPRLSLADTDASASITQAMGTGLVGGPSEYFMRRVIKSLLKGTCSREVNLHLETVCDPAGSFYRYKKAYLGLAYDVFTGVDYDTTVDYTSGVTPLGAPRVRLDASGNLLSSPSCKKLVGVRVLGLAGANPDDATAIPNGYYYVPGGTATVAPFTGLSSLPSSPLLGKVQPGDVITHFRNAALGDLDKQIAPSLVTWRLCAGDQVEFTYRRGGNALNTADNSLTENYENDYTQNVCLLDFPAFLDYPWYAVNIFPLLRATAAEPYPGFVFPNNQVVNPQLPQLSGFQYGQFHPAL
jgi:S1-C subfamily serine protease